MCMSIVLIVVISFFANNVSSQFTGPVLVMVNESRIDVDGSGNRITIFNIFLRGFDNETAAGSGLLTLESTSTFSIVRSPCGQNSSTNRCAQSCNQNTSGIYQCSCNSGYNDTTTAAVTRSSLTQSGFTCVDIDECRLNSSVCGTGQASCNNTVGSYTCTCSSGYQVSASQTSCENVNECSNNTLNNCDTNASCTDTIGGFNCTCNSGYTGNGTSCTDVNECTTQNITCGGNGNCVNQAGGFTCNCSSGFTLNNTGTLPTCRDMDECRSNSSCDTNATCSNTVGSFNCACNSGYQGDGRTCSDINECSNSTLNNCHANATCSNTPAASFTCACISGFVGNGVNCTALGQLSYCFRAIINASLAISGTSISRLLEVQTAVNQALGQYNSVDPSLAYGSVTTSIERFVTGSNQMIVNICLTNMTKTANELAQFMSSINPTARIGGATISVADYDECETNYPNCSSQAVCVNTNGSFVCRCPSTRYDNSTVGSTGLKCVEPVSYTCSGTTATLSLVIPYYAANNINVSNIFINTNCSGISSGQLHVYTCDGNVTTNATHVIAAFTLEDVIRTYSTRRVNTTFYCTQPASQNITNNLIGIDSVLDPDIPNFSSTGSSLVAKVFTNGFNKVSNVAGISTGDSACIQLVDSNLGADIQIVFEDCWTGAPGKSAQFSLLRDYCPVVNPGLTTTTDEVNGGICFTMHRPRDSTLLEVIMTVNLCTGSDCPSRSCSKKRRSVDKLARTKRSSNVVTVSTLITIDPDDRCNRDCGVGACLLDFARQQQCVCPVHSLKSDSGTCVARTESDNASTQQEKEGGSVASLALSLLVGFGVLLLVVVFVAALVLIRRRRAQLSQDVKLSDVQTPAM